MTKTIARPKSIVPKIIIVAVVVAGVIIMKNKMSKVTSEPA
tara:strand:+ start:384 stop:506 length:123 start_codon:yes stop_codon:yes gene_type:complete